MVFTEKFPGFPKTTTAECSLSLTSVTDMISHRLSTSYVCVQTQINPSKTYGRRSVS